MYSLDDIGAATTTSCSYWGSQGQNSLPLIVDTSTGSPDLYNMFGYVEGGYLYVPAMVALDHNLKVVYHYRLDNLKAILSYFLLIYSISIYYRIS